MALTIPQTDYSLYFDRAKLGMAVYAAEIQGKISKIASKPIPYGRFVVQSRLFDTVCRLPRSNKVVMTDDAGTFTAGSITTVLVHGNLVNYIEDAQASTTTTVTTNWISNKNATMTAHAAAIAAAMSDCYSCTYSSSAHTITYIGDSEDIITATTTPTASGAYDSLAAVVDVISTADLITDVLGLSFISHNIQQAITTSVAMYQDTEAVNICRRGSIYVYAPEIVLPSSTPIYIRTIKSSTNYAGYVNVTSDGSNQVTLAKGKFIRSITAAGLVGLEIMLP